MRGSLHRPLLCSASSHEEKGQLGWNTTETEKKEEQTRSKSGLDHTSTSVFARPPLPPSPLIRPPLQLVIFLVSLLRERRIDLLNDPKSCLCRKHLSVVDNYLAHAHAERGLTRCRGSGEESARASLKSNAAARCSLYHAAGAHSLLLLSILALLSLSHRVTRSISFSVSMMRSRSDCTRQQRKTW